MAEIAFYGFSALAIGAALTILFTRNVMYAALCLFIALLGVAALYVLAGADFLAITQLLIYVGGVLVLLIFGVMLTHRAERESSQKANIVLTTHLNRFWGALIALSIFGLLFWCCFQFGSLNSLAGVWLTFAVRSRSLSVHRARHHRERAALDGEAE
jgi:NADH-quinone oxidoreductase subunit J